MHEFYDRLSFIFSYLVDTLGVTFKKLADVPNFYRDAGAPDPAASGYPRAP